MLKLYLGSEHTMKTNPSTHPRAVQKTWTIRNRYGHRYAKIYIPPTVSVLDGRLKALVWFWLIDETLSANLVYQDVYEIGSTTPSDEAMTKIMTMVIAW